MKSTLFLVMRSLLIMLSVVGLALLVGWWGFKLFPELNAAHAWVRSVRPALVALQCLALGLTWTFWPQLLERLTVWGVLSEAGHAGLLRAKHRVLGVLIAMQALIVLRAVWA